MKADEAKRALQASVEDEAPATLTVSVLSKLTRDDMPEGASFQVGTHAYGITHLDWSGTFYRADGEFFGEADHTWTRKYWYSPLGLEQYLDLVRRAVESRERVRGDVNLTHFDDDGAYVSLYFRIQTSKLNLGDAYDQVLGVATEVEEAAQKAADEVSEYIAGVAARLSGWGTESLDSLVDAVGTALSANEKGQALEELCSRLFGSVEGFTVTQRIRTETEEIDLSIINGSADARLAREQALIIAECKNWTGSCGKNEFVIFREKMENRNRRCSLGFLISWNGFATTVTKEMLRGSREDLLIVPMTGEDIREAVRASDFLKVLLRCWEKAVTL